MRENTYNGSPINSVPSFIAPKAADEQYPLRMLVTKSHGFLNSQYANEQHKLSAQGEQKVIIHPDDALEFGIKNESFVRLSNENGCLDAIAIVSDRTTAGTLVSSFGYWRSLEGGGLANSLTATSAPGFAGTPAYYDTFVAIEMSSSSN